MQLKCKFCCSKVYAIERNGERARNAHKPWPKDMLRMLSFNLVSFHLSLCSQIECRAEAKMLEKIQICTKDGIGAALNKSVVEPEGQIEWVEWLGIWVSYAN